MRSWMPVQLHRTDATDRRQAARYVVNGLVATAVHFGVLSFNLRELGMTSAGAANVCAAVAGIIASFVGNRYFVFQRAAESRIYEGERFGLLYATIACLHGLVLYAWTDLGRMDYRLGFLLATGMQVILSYWGNKRLVFKA